MDKIIVFVVIFSLVFSSVHVHADEKIKVLIVNDVYDRIPAKNEKLERLGSIKGELLVMGTRYSGDIDVWRGNDGLYIINELPLEEYIKDVVAVEVRNDWDIEALKAQAVISRTYALYQKSRNGSSLYHLASSVLHQVYKGNNPDIRIAYAVEQTRGEILTYQGRVIEALYHSTCGGKTENPEDVFGKSYPYLKSVESHCDLSPYTEWERTFQVSEIERIMNISGIKDIIIKSFTLTNRVKHIEIITNSKTFTMSANEMRKALGWKNLPSTNFTVSKNGNLLIFEGKGYGHGVGLCQWSALKMAREGQNYKDILAFFYPGTTLQLYENH
ncbi:MAG: SpoIID/LytB domain-containing protein [Nitrospirota bacterium]